MDKLMERVDKMDPEEQDQLRKLLRERHSDGSEESSSKMKWMYTEDRPEQEEYLLGRRVDKYVDDEDEKMEEKNKDTPGALFQDAMTRRADLDMHAKMREDPLYAIKKKEEEARRRILENPIRLKQLQKMAKKNKKEKKKRKEKKHRHRSSDNDSSDEEGNDIMHKYLAILKQKKEKSSHQPKEEFIDGDQKHSSHGNSSSSRTHPADSDEESTIMKSKSQKPYGLLVKLTGFPSREEESDTEATTTRKLVRDQNRKKTKSGGFQVMGLSYSVYKGIIRKGYKIPTPIQRKTIPLILDGKDVVAMARTGSGKTAAFLLPMFERLQSHSAAGARALILSPTRELALQTLKFTKELGKFTGLRSAVILGGDRLEAQFAALHENPDIILATPGRFMHVCVEMDLKLGNVEYVVFDEADRLFELGFQEQLTEILARLPEDRQTLLFSATLPKLLVEFAKAGLHDPTLLRLDVDTKLSENLKMAFLQCRSDDKLAILLHLLRNVIRPSEQTVVFVATKHHVEYVSMILQEAGLSCSHSYSALDPTARKINVAKFRAKKTRVLVVTDLAARGIDIPFLDNVINVNMPAKPKLFVHRVGRVARAGHSGTAYSLVGPDELSYMLDLHLFLGRPLKTSTTASNFNAQSDGVFGRVPQSVLDEEDIALRQWLAKSDVANMTRVVNNAYKQYAKSRPPPSNESIKRMKEVSEMGVALHPMFGDSTGLVEKQTQILDYMKAYKPQGTIFEINATNKTTCLEIMQKKRGYHQTVIGRKRQRQTHAGVNAGDEGSVGQTGVQSALSTEEDIQGVFSRVIAPVPPEFENGGKIKRVRPQVRDEENYLHYRPPDYQSEKGLSLGTSFDRDAAAAEIDIGGDDQKEIRKRKGAQVWDRKKKKFVSETGLDEKKGGQGRKVKTESGAWIKSSYKSNIYKTWLNRSKTGEREDVESDTEEGGKGSGKRPAVHGRGQGMEVMGAGNRSKKRPGQDREPPAMQKRHQGGRAREIQKKEQILKHRRKKEKLESFMAHKGGQREKRKKDKRR